MTARRCTQGRKARFVPGWDCHGLPIELKVLQGMDEEQRRQLTPIKLRRKARDFALKTVESQKQQFMRWSLGSSADVCVLASLLSTCVQHEIMGGRGD